jgi:S-(hydroxymethyl)glutathione dehydrogenase/alcohol dehydrogenase
MRAALFVGTEEPLSIEDVESLPPGPRDVVVRVGASGVCHSDLSVANGSAFPVAPPCVLGHEGAGRVEEVGSEVTRVAPGDRVIAAFNPACGNCWFCLRDQSHLCEAAMAALLTPIPKVRRSDGSESQAFLGLGTFSDVMTVHEWSLVKVETDLPDEQLALLGCGVTTGVGAVLNTAQVRPGSSVAVIGCGGVGQAVIQGARIAGAAHIFAIDPVELKRTAAAAVGATDLIDPTDGDPVEQVRQLTGGRGTDYAFEVIGLPETMLQAHATVRRGGMTVVIGMPRLDSQVTLSAFSLFSEAKHLVGSMYGSAQVRSDFPRFVDLVETGRLDLGGMVSRRIKIDEVNDAFRAMEAGEVIRSVII